MYYATPGTYIESYSVRELAPACWWLRSVGWGGSSLTLCGVTNDIQLNGGSDLGCDTTFGQKIPAPTQPTSAALVGGTMIVQGPAGGR